MLIVGKSEKVYLYFVILLYIDDKQSVIINTDYFVQFFTLLLLNLNIQINTLFNKQII
jgi:hypothetical protein